MSLIMRIKITFTADKSGIIDFNYQHQIQAIIYSFLSMSNPDYAQWLHQQGFAYKKDKRFKLFVFSGISFYCPIKIIRSNRLNGLNGLNRFLGLNGLNGFSFKSSHLSPFTLSFQIASPVDKFIQHLIEGIFGEGQEVRLGKQTFSVCRVETLTDPLETTTGSSSSNSVNSSNGLNGLNRLNRLNRLNGLNGLNGLNSLNSLNSLNRFFGLNGLYGLNSLIGFICLNCSFGLNCLNSFFSLNSLIGFICLNCCLYCLLGLNSFLGLNSLNRFFSLIGLNDYFYRRLYAIIQLDRESMGVVI